MKIKVSNKVKYKGVAFFVFIILLCSSTSIFIMNSSATSITSEINENIQSNFKSSISEEDISFKSFDNNENELEDIAQESVKKTKINSGDDSGNYGVWLRTEYEDTVNTKKLNIGIIKFFIMLTMKTEEDFSIGLENPGDTTMKLRFLPKTTNVEGEGKIKVIQTDFILETNCDTSKEYLVSLEVRFPFSLIENTAEYIFNSQSATIKNFQNKKIELFHKLFSLPFGKNEKTNDFGFLEGKKYHQEETNDEAYFSFRTGFSSKDGDVGPSKVTTSFYFGKESIWDPIVIGKKISPDNAGISDVTYFSSLHTVDESGNDSFHRFIGVDFAPVVELEVIYIPRNGRTIYKFGPSAEVETKITFHTEGGIGILEKLTYSIVFNPLPNFMNFDINLIHGDNLFEFYYHSNNVHNIEFLIESTSEEDDSAFSVELGDIPSMVEVTCDLSIYEQTVDGEFYFEISSDTNPSITASVYKNGWTISGGTVFNFNQLTTTWNIDFYERDGLIDIQRSEGESTAFIFTLSHDDWTISDTIDIINTHVQIYWDLPTPSNRHVEFGLDFIENSLLFNNCITITKGSVEIFIFELEIKTGDKYIVKWDYDQSGKIINFNFVGEIFKINDLNIKVDFQGSYFTIQGNWNVGEYGELSLTLNKEVEFTIVDIETNDLKLNIKITFNPGSTFGLKWDHTTDWEEGTFEFNATSIAETQLELGVGPIENGEHKFGFFIKVSSEYSLEDTFWWDHTGYIPKCGWNGDGPTNTIDWEIYLLLNHNWLKIWPIIE
jgi:hypothetical protein